MVLIDEAHAMPKETLEEIRLLSNLETSRHKLLQIVLFGQPELDEKLDLDEYRQLRQRIALRCRLRPFTESETAEYVGTRLAKSGLRDQHILPPHILARIHRGTEGIPRLINSVCDNLLLTSYAMESPVVTEQMYEEVARDLRLESNRQALGR